MWDEAAKNKPAVPGCCAQTGLHLSYVCQNAGTIPEGWFGGGRVSKADDQSGRYDCKESLSEQAQSARMSAWRESVLAVDAKKAGSASEDTRLTPRPPSFTGRLA